MLKSLICWNLVPTHIKTIAFRSLTYTIPGLDAVEQKYVKSQVDTIVNFDYIAACGKKQKGGEKTPNIPHLLPLQRLTVLLDQIKLKDKTERKQFYEQITEKEKKYRAYDSFYIFFLFHRHKNSYISDRYQIADIFKKLLKIQQNQLQNPAAIIKDVDASSTTKLIENISVSGGLSYYEFTSEFSTLNITDIKLNEEIDFMRNLYIITRLLKLPLGQIFHENENLDVQKLALVSNLAKTNSLEVLIQLNVYDQILLKSTKYEAEKNIILKNLARFTFYPTKACKEIQNYELSPVVYYSQFLTNIGYSMQTVRNLFGTNQPKIQESMRRIDQIVQMLKHDILSISASMSKSQQLLEETVWTVDNMCDEEKLIRTINTLNQREKMSRYKKNTIFAAKPTIKYLSDYITSKYGESAKNNLYRASYFQTSEVCLFWSLLNINMLEVLGFTDHQIAAGIGIITYPPVEIRNMMQEMEENPEDYPGLECSYWRDDPKALMLVCYYMEKSRGFSLGTTVTRKQMNILSRYHLSYSFNDYAKHASY